jgi:uncharacterized protein (TIGR03000 family)
MRLVITETMMLAALLWVALPATAEARGGGGGHGGGGHGGGHHGGGHHGGGSHHRGNFHRGIFYGGSFGYGGYSGYGGWGYWDYAYPDGDYDEAEEITAEQSAHLVVTVPPDADVYFDNYKTTQSGATRQFVTPPLAPGNYQYHIRATWMDNGRRVDQTQNVTIHPGDEIRVNFLPTRSPPANQP